MNTARSPSLPLPPRSPCAAAFLGLLACAAVSAAAPPIVRHEIALTDLPVLPFGGEYLLASIASGLVTSAEVTVSLVTEGDFDARYFLFEFVGPTGGVSVRGDQLGWSGQGSFATTFTTQNFAGELPMQGRGPTLHFYFMNAATVNPLFPAAGHLADSRVVLDIQPCPADFDGSFRLDIGDLFAFLSAYFSDSPTADLDSSGSVTVGDLFTFLSLYFAGCDAF